MAQLSEICRYADELLGVTRFRDYAPNGLQVEGREEVRKLVSGVTASLALIEAALDFDADAILVHHGYFWRGEPAEITGSRRRRLKALLANDLSLMAYHLPLDAHPELGNNAQLAKRLGFTTLAPLTAEGVGSIGHPEMPLTLHDLVAHITRVLGREPLVIPAGPASIERIAWCTGAAQGYLEQAATQGAQAYLSGEISEQTVHAAREAGVHYLAAGHHATERYGVQALGEYLAARWGLDHQFVDIDNPV
ncbi:Nif3-like dinuclear metal center hexameric protein [Acidihalobacter yilgarnensis]|uniref:GTP cyclohydrolase 1 type 2 homolog n=1 Tax=Acidihalobacter yilgarnensis TaxID=2819280 RepID=A0A1D8IRB1_9GAMM|nr:Nif3-like dinuclear metal center hexameric protein [Acidihalobacter yilgarnensis]AOU99020.1 Nif3-like dinuclear metal center hexameric protein [Acidihalobacter yilgarnensis]